MLVRLVSASVLTRQTKAYTQLKEKSLDGNVIFTLFLLWQVGMAAAENKMSADVIQAPVVQTRVFNRLGFAAAWHVLRSS